MVKNSFENRTERRDRLIGLLRSQEHWTTSELRVHLGVSQRTLMRELATLRRGGYPIESDRGKGGGLSLDGRWGIERLHLSHGEVIELILALAVMENLHSPILTGNLRGIRQKLFQAFPHNQRTVVAGIRKRIFVGNQASKETASLYKQTISDVAEHVSESFLKQNMMEIGYVSESGERTSRVIEAQYIVLNWPMWYVLAWDHLRNSERIFRLDRIEWATLCADSFKLRPKATFANMYVPGFQTI